MMSTNNDTEDIQHLKKLIYNLTYMDNSAVTFNSKSELRWAYENLTHIFHPFGFELQQYNTNESELYSHIGEKVSENSEILGLNWNIEKDTLSTKKKILNPDANTKRQVLSTIAETFDPYNLECPLLNRARIFLNKLQRNKDLNWDQKLSRSDTKVWANICKQWNNAPSLSIPRCVGERSDHFNLIAYTDSSKEIYGTVIYLQNKKDNSIH